MGDAEVARTTAVDSVAAPAPAATAVVTAGEEVAKKAGRGGTVSDVYRKMDRLG